MSTCGCFSPISQWLKSCFRQKDEPARIIEIGPPTNFRKEEFSMPTQDDDQSTLHRNDSHGVMTEKEAAQSAAAADVVRKTSTRDQLRSKVLRISAKLTS